MPSWPGPAPRNSAGPWPTPPPCVSPASTPRTTMATGTRSTTPSPPPTPSTRRCGAPPRRPSSGGEVAEPADLAALQACWDQEGRVDEAGAVVYRHLLVAGGDPARVIAL